MPRWTMLASAAALAGCHAVRARPDLAPAPGAWRAEAPMLRGPRDADVSSGMGLLDRVRSLLLGSDAATPERHVVRGFPVLVENSRPDIETPAVLRRLDDALALIETHQPWRFAHLRRDVDQLWVVRYPCRGAFFADTRTCMTELTFLARTDITAAPVASSILHEGMHARVHAMGVSPVQRDMAHEERICRRAELAFGESLPPALGQPVIERARASLLLDDADVAPAIDWAEAQRRQAAIDAAARSRR